MKARAFDLRRLYNGDYEFVAVLTPDSVPEAMRLIDGAKGKLYEIVCKVFRKKRTIPANAYFHKLVNLLAAVLHVDDDEMKTHLVLKYGTIAEINDIPVTFRLPHDADPADFYRYAKWYESDADTDTYICYKQTHTMTGAEFARLIDGTVEDCKELGIETLPRDELEEMYAQADKAYRDSKRREKGGL